MSKDDHSVKLKEILGTQTKIMKLKKERMEGLKVLEEGRLQKRIGNGKRTIMMMSRSKKNNGTGKKSLDRRSRILKVEGWTDEQMNEVRLYVVCDPSIYIHIHTCINMPMTVLCLFPVITGLHPRALCIIWYCGKCSTGVEYNRGE
jgi:hypothetical protein